MDYHIGQKISGHITGIKPYGAFVVLDDHVQGLIHISECKTGVVRALKNELKIGQKVVVTVLDIEQYNNKISLSLRQDDIMVKQGLHKKIQVYENIFGLTMFLIMVLILLQVSVMNG